MQELQRLAKAGVAIDIRAKEGLADAIDAAAALADPRHGFLRRAWYAGDTRADATTVTAATPDGRVIAALPTVATSLPWLRAVAGGYWPYRSFPIAADASDEELAALLAARATRHALGPAWRLGPVYADDPTLGRLERSAPAAGWTMLRRRIAPRYVLDIEAVRAEGAWPRNSTLKKNRFHEKHLAAHGALEWRFVSGAGWTNEIFDALAEVERKSWISTDTDGSDAKFMAPHHRRSWEAAVADPVLAEAMRAAILFIDGAPAAFCFDLDAGAVKYAIANSYDERFAKHSPGKCLYYRNLVEAMARGISLVDWGAGDSGYKRTIGADRGPDIVDILIVRNRALAALLRPLWRRSGR